ncbi:MAG: PleD family two-component system response regulator [Rhodospirillaceae bacterium]|nr:PleD family two-component system response regulator [Rhodospirillaceae bacterium]
MPARILVVDDVPANVGVLEAKLSSEYFDVSTAADGPTALAQIRQSPPDLVLLDVMMPGMDGFEVCRRIRADIATQHLPVVMVTALSDIEDRVKGLEAGADDFLTKPVDDTALFARIRSLVRMKMTMDEWRLREATRQQIGAVVDARPPSLADAQGARILLVEDVEVTARRIKDVLASDRHKVEVAASARNALALTEGRDFDLILLSLTLGSDDGLRLCSQLRSQERTRQVPILLIIEPADVQKLAKGLDLGAADYLGRPLDRNEVLARVRTQIRRKRYQDRLRTNYENNLSLAFIDTLTGLHNRRYLDVHFRTLAERLPVHRKIIAVQMIDIDRFKPINDTYGHAAGDEVLRAVAQRIARNLRGFDTVIRWGGEEFVVIMPETTMKQAMMVAERLRRRIADSPITLPPPVGNVQVTISIGVAATVPGGVPGDALLREADIALYRAKNEGRNRVCASGVAIP